MSVFALWMAMLYAVPFVQRVVMNQKVLSAIDGKYASIQNARIQAVRNMSQGVAQPAGMIVTYTPATDDRLDYTIDSLYNNKIPVQFEVIWEPRTHTIAYENYKARLRAALAGQSGLKKR